MNEPKSYLIEIAGQMPDALYERALQEVVRCHDCYFAEEIEGGYWCDRFDCGKEHVTANGFCAWGERRGE